MHTKTSKNTFLYIFLLSTGACLLYAVGSGIRSNYGIMLGAIAAHAGVDYASVSFILAVGQLVFGIAQPAFGIFALKKSNLAVLITGSLLMAAGLVLTGISTSFFLLFLALGLILPTGTGAISFGIIMSLITPKLGERKAATVSGFVSASSGIGSTVFSPLIQFLLSEAGLMGTMLILFIPVLILIPISAAMTRGGKTNIRRGDAAAAEPFLQIIKSALGNKTYLLVTLGFFTCGFHMCIIETHLFSQLLTYKIAPGTAALVFSTYGIFTMLGCVISGFASARISPCRVLSVLYFSRCVIVVLFLILPKSFVTVMGFGILLGLTAGATVTPTSVVVNRLFGAKKLATLFGFCFLAHQIGAFFSAWLGGLCVTSVGSYTLIWCASIFFSLCAGTGCALANKNFSK